MIRFCSILAALLLLLTAGCRTTGGYRHELTMLDTGRTLTLEQGDVIRIVLDSNPSTGYFWAEDGKPDSDVIRLAAKQFLPSDQQKQTVGASRNVEFIYKVVGSGETGIRLNYKRPWETVPPAERFQIKILVSSPVSFMDRFDRSRQPLRRVDSQGRVAPPLSEVPGR